MLCPDATIISLSTEMYVYISIYTRYYKVSKIEINMIAAWSVWIAVGVCSEYVREKKANLITELPLPHSQFLQYSLLQLNMNTHCDSYISRSKSTS